MFSLLLLLSCKPEGLVSAQGIALTVPTEADTVVASFLAPIDDERLFVGAAAEGDTAVSLALGLDGCTECYTISGEQGLWTVQASDVLGLQYGLADMLERHGYRFPHPFHTVIPETLPLEIPTDRVGEVIAPEKALRGLHLHTLHPIEGLWSTWDQVPDRVLDTGPYTDVESRFAAVVDWTVKNRGNRLQWVALDDITDGPATLAEWRERTARLNAVAAERGVSTSLGIQLFGSGNLQQAFDLLDDAGDRDGWRDQLDTRLAQVTGVGFAAFDLSFGEFFGEDPETFIAAVEQTHAALVALQPDAGLSAVIHVGDSEDQRVVYEGVDQIYYFLVQYADAPVIPRVHTVMYYDLYEDAGGAYHHQDFGEHRDFLLERLEQGQPVQYFPESAYWVAFDNPVPLYLPLYVRSRWLDQAELRADAAAGGFADLDAHMLFSSGWEWGYWQGDAMTLRMNHTLPDDWADLYTWWFAPLGAEGEAAAAAAVALGERQQQDLIERRLAPYLAGRDAAMDVGFSAGIVAAPDRVTLTEAAALSSDEAAAFRSAVVDPLSAHADALEAILAGLPSAPQDRYVAEIRDGVAVDALRARFAADLYTAVLDADAGGLSAADQALAQARTVVDRRHADLHDPIGAVLVDDSVSNPTIYDYGYLVRAEQLCFWERERVEAARILEGSTEAVPGCF
ncbi:MAG: hypothetical protein H6742_12370 [Alphaproteobacteria bacterium]|nr:hypothetical protein [Alphaproteobacteria bacterium]